MNQGFVIYTDGGCRPSRGFGGWGIHGYLYSHDAPKKGAGQGDNVLTQKGYLEKEESASAKQVTPVHYVDGHGSFLEEVTNNIAEIVAATKALEHAEAYVVSSVLIYTDSEYVINGITKWVDGWIRNDWSKGDGGEIANVAFWKDLVAIKTRLEERGTELTFKWVKGHNGSLGNSLGNTIADRFATLAVMLSKKGIHVNSITTSTPEGYWKYEVDKHPMLANRRCYFNTIPETIIPGEYYLGDHSKEDDMIGTRVSDGAFSVVRLKEPEPVLEMVRKHQSNICGGRDALIMLRLDKLFSPNTHEELCAFGEVAIVQPNQHRLDLNDIKDEPLSREFNPPKLAVRAVLAIGELANLLDMTLANDPRVTTTDLTPILYEASVKVKKVKGGGEEQQVLQKLKADYNVGYAALDVQANYKDGEEIKAVPLTLTLGIDLLDRNSLKRLETASPVVRLITWQESPTAFRYATVVTAGEDCGIWAGVYSNLRIVS